METKPETESLEKETLIESDWVPIRAWRDPAKVLPVPGADGNNSTEVLILCHAGYMIGYYCHSSREWFESYHCDLMKGSFTPKFWMALPDKPETTKQNKV